MRGIYGREIYDRRTEGRTDIDDKRKRQRREKERTTYLKKFESRLSYPESMNEGAPEDTGEPKSKSETLSSSAELIVLKEGMLSSRLSIASRRELPRSL